jgi:hypothetical protein
MARLARIVIPGLPHHVTQSGNRREAIFFEDGDHEIYLDLLAEQALKAGVAAWAYCLMPNHVQGSGGGQLNKLAAHNLISVSQPDTRCRNWVLHPGRKLIVGLPVKLPASLLLSNTTPLFEKERDTRSPTLLLD